ncbi:RebB family R body protein [Kordia sp.]|uniref:RebB family R body protein n=1 Tax=Kordia sp. TaxID=1965332 RepID=UPI003D6A12D7
MAKKTKAQPKSFPTAVNSQITDSVTQVNTKVLGDAPAVATGNLTEATSEALSNAAHNATTEEPNSALTAQAAITQSLETLYSIDTASTDITAGKILKDTE